MTTVIPSIVRWLLTFVGTWLASLELIDFDLSTATIGTLILGIVSTLVALALKVVDKYTGGGVLSGLSKILVGPRVEHISASVSRWIITIIGGSIAAFLQVNEAGVEDVSVEVLAVAGVSFLIDRVWKYFKK